MSAGGFHVLRHVFCVHVEEDVVQIRNEEADLFFSVLEFVLFVQEFHRILFIEISTATSMRCGKHSNTKTMPAP